MTVARIMLTAFGLGHLRPASGTWGSTPPPALALLLVWWLGADGFTGSDTMLLHLVLVAVGTAFGAACLAWGGWSEELYRRKDPRQVVADEVAGQTVALMALPWRAMVDLDAVIWNAAMAATAFFAFRFFDILKPPPVRRLERLGGGGGILLDDLCAGVYALIVTQLIVRFALPAVITAV